MRHARAALLRSLVPLVLLTLAAQPASGHLCDRSSINAKVGQAFVFVILADVIESQPSNYSITTAGNATIASVFPNANFSAFGFAAYRFRANSVGNTSYAFQWSYPPMSASGSCSFAIHVTAASGEDATDANYDFSFDAGDPVSTLTGEYYFVEDIGFELGGPFPLDLEFFYGSTMLNDGLVVSRVGNNWMTNFDLSLFEDTGNNEVLVAFERGRILRFTGGPNWTLAEPLSIPFQLVESGTDFLLLDPRDHRIFTFDTNGQLTSISDGKGNTHTLSYQGPLLTQVTDGIGRTLTFSYDNFHDIDEISAGTRTLTLTPIFTGSRANLGSIADARGNATSYTYDGSDPLAGLMTSRTRPEGNTPFTQVYTSKKVTSQTDALMNTTTLSYGAGTTTVTNPLGEVTTHTHSVVGEGTDLEDDATTSIGITYDGNGRPSTLTSREGRNTIYTYDAISGKIATETGPTGSVTSYGYTSRDVSGLTLRDLTQITYDDGTIETYVYDANGNLTSSTDRAGETRTYTYNARGQLLTETDPAGAVTTRTYNADGTLATHQDASGNVTTHAYDALRRRVSTTRPDTSVATVTYDANDNILTLNDELSATTTFTYDLNDNLATVTDADTNVVTFTYDDMDRLVSVLDRDGNTVSTAFDPLGRLASSTDGNSNATTFAYDNRGYLTTVTGPDSAVTTFGYDLEGNLTSITDALTRIVSFGNDGYGRPTRITSPLLNDRFISYDDMGRIETTTDPLGNVTTYAYDARGQLDSVTKPEGITTSYVRNDLGQVIERIDPRGKSWLTGRDVAGRRTSSTDPLGNVITYTYDNRDRVDTWTSSEGSVTIGYDALDGVTQRSYSDGTLVNYTYDALHRLDTTNGQTRAYNNEGDLVDSNGLAMVRDGAGRLTSVTFVPGKTVTYGYDLADRVTQVTDWEGGSTTFGYDAVGRLETITRPNGVNTTYGYDADDNLVSLTEGTHVGLVLTHDAAGQTTTVSGAVELAGTLPNGVQNFGYDDASQVSTYTHDGLGRVTSDGTRSYTWNLASQVEQASQGPTTTTFTYDGLGSLTSQTTGGTTTSYVWNYGIERPVISVLQEGGADKTYFVHTPKGSLLHSIDANTGARHFYHYDDMGNTLLLTDDASAVAAAYAYSPYGKLAASSGITTNPFTWQGELGVLTLGFPDLYSMFARFYDANSARFLSRDRSVASGPRNNPYVYALSNPLRYVDADGRTASSAQDQQVDAAIERVLSGQGRRPNYDFSGSSASSSAQDEEFSEALSRAESNLREQGDKAGKKLGLSSGAGKPGLTSLPILGKLFNRIGSGVTTPHDPAGISANGENLTGERATPRRGGATGQSGRFSVGLDAIQLRSAVSAPRIADLDTRIDGASGYIGPAIQPEERRGVLPGVPILGGDGDSDSRSGSDSKSGGERGPFLGDLPFIGELFRNRSQQDDDGLIFLVTPSITQQEEQ